MLTNGGHISFNNMRHLILLPMKVHINESSMEKILYFSDVANIAGVHIKTNKSKGKVINVHIKDRKNHSFQSMFRESFQTTLMTVP